MATVQMKTITDSEGRTRRVEVGSTADAKYTGAAVTASGYTSKPVSVLSTENAVTDANKNLNKLNVLSPTTAPGYIAPKKDVSNLPGKESMDKTLTPSEPEKPKTVKFVNADNQVVTLTDQQLYNQDTIDMLKNGGYVFSEGEFVPKTDETGAITVSDKPKEKTGYYSYSNGIKKWNDTSGTGLGPNGESAESLALDESNQKIQRALDEFNSYNVDADPNFQPIASGIRANFDNLRNQTIKTNEARARAYETAGMRAGTTEFAGGVQMSIEGGELDQANARLAEITRQENDAITAARSAYQTGKWEQFDKQIALLEQQREEKALALKDYNDKLAEAINTQREEERQFGINATVVNAIANGAETPAEIFTALSKSGISATAKEIQDAMGAFAIKADTSVDKLTGDTRNFFLLKDMPGALPTSITTLPLEKQLGAYLQWSKDMTDGKTTTPSGKITNINANPTKADIANLPVSDLTKAVMSGFGKVKDLTPTDKSKVLTEMYQVGYNPQTYVMDKLSNLVTLWGTIPEESKGYIEGLKFWEGSMNPSVAAFNSAASVLTREIARLNDVGVLSDQDVETYTNAMPSRRDQSLNVVLNKIAGLQSTVVMKNAENVGKIITLKDGRTAIVSFDGETLLDPKTGKELQ